MWTKRKLIEAAFEELALAGFVYDLEPEELQSALRRLETMVAGWAAQGLHISYNFGDDIDADSGVSLSDTEAVFLQLAIRISASKGKNLSRATITAARAAYDSLLSKNARSDMRQQAMRSGVPTGSGNRVFGVRFTTNEASPSPDGLNFLEG